MYQKKVPGRSNEFRHVADDDLEMMADRALGAEPEPGPLPDEDDPLFLPCDLPTAEETAERFNRDRQRVARMAALPAVRDVLSSRRKRTFLISLAETGIIGIACSRAGWSRTVVLGLRKTDPDFSARYDEALEYAADIAEAEAFRRGVHGVEKAVYFKGQECGRETVYSDAMLTLTLKARRPERFRDSHVVQLESRGGVLLIPAVQSEGDWEASALVGQEQFRAPPDDV